MLIVELFQILNITSINLNFSNYFLSLLSLNKCKTTLYFEYFTSRDIVFENLIEERNPDVNVN